MASNSQETSLGVASQQTRENFTTVSTKMMEMLTKKEIQDPNAKVKLCVKSAHDRLTKTLLHMDHEVDWVGDLKVVSAQYYLEQMMKLMWSACCKYSHLRVSSSPFLVHSCFADMCDRSNLPRPK